MKDTAKNCPDNCANCAESELITCSYVENKVCEILAYDSKLKNSRSTTARQEKRERKYQEAQQDSIMNEPI